MIEGGGLNDQICEQLDLLISDVSRRGRISEAKADRWKVAEITLGLLATFLAATAGATGLLATAGRVPAAFIALAAAGIGAANQFLGSNDRFEMNRRLANALQAIEFDACLLRAAAGQMTEAALLADLRILLSRRIAAMDMDHRPVTSGALHGASSTP